MSSHRWSSNFEITPDEIEYLINLLVERETPLTTPQLAAALVERVLAEEAVALEQRYKDVEVYNPSHSYEVGQRLVFPQMEYATARVVEVRPGQNPDYGDFTVIGVQFEPDSSKTREFAASLATPHKLSQSDTNGHNPLMGEQPLSVEEVMRVSGDTLTASLQDKLSSVPELISVTRQWFPRELLLQPNDGHLNLAEAVLDIMGGGPLTTPEILEQIGGIGDAPVDLQIFSLNYVLNADRRFDEVGPRGQVLWYLAALKPAEVKDTPVPLRSSVVDYERDVLSAEETQIEAEIGDELSDLEAEAVTEATITLIYPHRRAGTLPLNAKMAQVFPGAQVTQHIWITLVDGQDDTEYNGWIVPKGRYVFGLGEFYRKHRIPIGAYVTASQTETPGRIRIDFNAYRPRTEWIRLVAAKGDQILFENHKRSIGADYDDLMILGIDDLESLDALVTHVQRGRTTLAGLLRMVIPPLGRLTPQGTAHVKTIYSAVNVLRRCPPGPIIATLETNPDFQNVGGHYWKLADE